jgi:hypothetical protein
LLFGCNYLLFPMREVRCNSIVIPLFRKAASRLQTIETIGPAARHRARICKNSLLIPLLSQIAKRFQHGAARIARHTLSGVAGICT